MLSEYLSFYLGVEEDIRDEVSLNCHRVAKDCFTEVVDRWLSHEDGTGDSPHTMETVLTAFNKRSSHHFSREFDKDLYTVS